MACYAKKTFYLRPRPGVKGQLRNRVSTLFERCRSAATGGIAAATAEFKHDSGRNF